MVILNKHLRDDGAYYEINDFEGYADRLLAGGIQPPPVKYRVFVPTDVKHQLDVGSLAWETEIAKFYRLGRDTGIDFEIVDVSDTSKEGH